MCVCVCVCECVCVCVVWIMLSLYLYTFVYTTYDLLTQLINCCLDCGVMPSTWKVGCITPMPKGSSLKVPGDLYQSCNLGMYGI